MRMDHFVVKHDRAERRPTTISDDRGLLKHLRMSDSDAGMFLGRSRQTLITHLGPKKKAPNPPPTDYFSLIDIVILVSAARQMGKAIDANALRDYVDKTRMPAEGMAYEPYAMLIGLLGGSSEEVSTAGANTVVFVMPAFAELRAHRPEVAQKLWEMANAKADSDTPPPSFYLLASTNFQAKAAGRWLGIDDEHCYGSEVIEHYLPSILIYRGVIDEPSPYVLAEAGNFVAAPRFMNHMVADCVRSLLPADIGQKLLPVEEDRRKVSGG